jgi:ribonuclease P protein component
VGGLYFFWTVKSAEKTLQAEEEQRISGNLQKKNTAATDTVVLYVKDSPGQVFPRAGFSVSKKLGYATKRNRYRRWMREALRSILPDIRPEKECVFIGRPAIRKANFRQVQKDMRRLLEKKDCLYSTEDSPMEKDVKRV